MTPPGFLAAQQPGAGQPLGQQGSGLAELGTERVGPAVPTGSLLTRDYARPEDTGRRVTARLQVCALQELSSCTCPV